ncbi:sensor histidine kinase [Paenibacillus sp. RRE4]|uniref:sensor histidine kinase n=1 Tax=Paenibacillus sp. RRE4 TaxID=2962587 RepID=UPI002881ADFB|nr:sensor histidine kinase [Paenibacillus sp. RRE4]MDT0121989.1 sensor histidine kinase [Paenibacillus sp. RRE4]
MFIAYLKYKKSWIALIGLLLLLTNALIQLDAGIRVEAQSLLYLNSLFLIIFLAFLVWRYKKETAYYKELLALSNRIEEDWFEEIPKPNSSFPDAMVYTLLEQIHQHDQNKRREDQSAQSMEHTDLASWVHEMKTPLTTMKITMDAHRSNELAERLHASWLRMHLLVDQQLYISRLANLDSDLRPEQVEVKQMLREEIRELSTWCMEKNISIELTGNVPSTVYTDKKWCRFVLRQLLTNAIKYSPADGDISIDTAPHENGSVIVTIRDEGPGIQAHDLPRIFDKGFTGENGRIQNSATGMGLYLANEISKKLHVQLQVASTVGEGTSISMIFTRDNPFEQLRRTLL